MPAVKFGCRNRSGSSRVGLPLALAPHEPAGERDQGHSADGHEQADELAALLPDEDAEHDAAHARGRTGRRPPRRPGADPVYGHVLDEVGSGESTTAMMTTSSPKPTRHERKVVTKPPSSGPIAAAIAAAAPTRA